jgi:hypothetical protein
MVEMLICAYVVLENTCSVKMKRDSNSRKKCDQNEKFSCGDILLFLICLVWYLVYGSKLGFKGKTSRINVNTSHRLYLF